MEKLPKIKVIGIGGAGCRLVNKMTEFELRAAEYYAIDDDCVTMERLKCENKIKLECGMRSAGDSGLCEQTAKSDRERLNGIVKGADMVILVAGVGGGFASAVAPLIAEEAKVNGILTVATVCTPLMSEEQIRQDNADRCIFELKNVADTAIIVPCGNGNFLTPFKLPMEKELLIADAMIESVLLTVLMPATVPGVINIEYNELTYVLTDSDKVYFGVGAYRGKDRALSAAKMAMDCPLSINFPDGANRLLVVVESGETPQTDEIRQISDYLASSFNASADIFFSVNVNESLGENMKVSVLATKKREENGSKRQ